MKKSIPCLALLSVCLLAQDQGCDEDQDGDGWTVQEGDCNDKDDSIHPGATDGCDGIDNNCDGDTDAGVAGADATCAGLSCAGILEELGAADSGVHWIDPDGSGASEVFCDMVTDGGGWLLARRNVSTNWSENPDDNLAGEVEYGEDTVNPVADSSFSIVFAGVEFSEFLFRTGDDEKWVQVDKSQVYEGWVEGSCGTTVTITASHLSSEPYTANWCKRPEQPEDPWISAVDHGSYGTSWTDDSDECSMLYGEDGGGTADYAWGYYVQNHDGANVWIR